MTTPQKLSDKELGEIKSRNQVFQNTKILPRHSASWWALDDRPKLLDHIAAITAERDEANAMIVAHKENGDFLRDTVGECHMMISCGTKRHTFRKEWDATTLPARLKNVVERAENAEAQLTAMRERLTEDALVDLLRESWKKDEGLKWRDTAKAIIAHVTQGEK